MKKNTSITELIAELQEENEAFHTLKKHFTKHFNDDCKIVFGYDAATVQKYIDKQVAYEQRVAERQGQRNQI